MTLIYLTYTSSSDSFHLGTDIECNTFAMLREGLYALESPKAVYNIPRVEIVFTLASQV